MLSSLLNTILAKREILYLFINVKYARFFELSKVQVLSTFDYLDHYYYGDLIC